VVVEYGDCGVEVGVGYDVVMFWLDMEFYVC
jgi:hypothetical protein